MKTLRRRQTTAPLGLGVLSLPVTRGERKSHLPLVSPYFQRSSLQKVGTGRNTNVILNYMAVNRAIIRDLEDGGYPNWFVVPYFLDGTTGAVVASYGVQFSIAGCTNRDQVIAAAEAAVISYASGQGYTLSAGIIWTLATDAMIQSLIAASALPMYVSGVATAGTYAVTAAPAVAGGSGVARFYVDTNGDGTGTAPSAIEIASLQAVVVNTSATYAIGSISVDTNRKYIDITMKALTFTTGLAGILSVLTGASLVNAANGTAVNCLVLVKQ